MKKTRCMFSVVNFEDQNPLNFSLFRVTQKLQHAKDEEDLRASIYDGVRQIFVPFESIKRDETGCVQFSNLE
jgi:hypothetical protein